jgi:hypothetical protein
MLCGPLIELRIRRRCRAIVSVIIFGNRFVGIENELALHAGPAFERHPARDISRAAGFYRGDRAGLRSAGGGNHLQRRGGESLWPTFLTLTIQKVDEVWVIFSMTRSGIAGMIARAGNGATSDATTARKRVNWIFIDWPFVIVLLLLLVIES